MNPKFISMPVCDLNLIPPLREVAALSRQSPVCVEANYKKTLAAVSLSWLLCLLPLLGVAADAGPRTVVVFGDSISAGNALPKEERTNVWVNLVEQHSLGKLKLVNEGKGGRPSDSVKEFEAMLQRQPQTDALVIALGTNDSRNTNADCAPKAVANLRTMISKARETYGAKLPVLLVGPPNINKSALGPSKPIAKEREAKLRELGDGFARLAKELGCDFVSLFGVVPETSLTKDGVHPDVAGNADIARVMLSKLQPE